MRVVQAPPERRWSLRGTSRAAERPARIERLGLAATSLVLLLGLTLTYQGQTSDVEICGAEPGRGAAARCGEPRASACVVNLSAVQSAGELLPLLPFFPDETERRAAAAAAFAAFPRLETICSTIREVDSAQRQRLAGVMFTRRQELKSRTYPLDDIVDRVGTGDAFAAGMLHGRVAGLADQDTLELGVAAAALKHSIRGDFNLVSLSDVEQLVAAKGVDIRR